MADLAAPPPAIVIPLEEPGGERVAGKPPERIEIPIAVPNTQQCQPQKDGEIVVCAPDAEAYRLRPLPQTAGTEPAKAEVKLGEGVSAGVGAEGAAVGGHQSNRVMATVKIAF